MVRENIKKDYFWNTLGVLMQNALSPVLLVIVTRISGIDGSGVFSFAFAISIIFWSVALWGGRTFQVSDVIGQFSVRGYIRTRLLLGTLVMFCSVGFVIVNGYSAEKAYLIIMLSLLKVSESIADVLYGVVQTGGRLYQSGISLVVKSIVGALAFMFALIYTHDLVVSSGTLLVVNSIVLICYDIPNSRQSRRLEKKHKIFASSNEVWRILKTTSPVFAMSLLSMLSINIPRYFVDRYHEDQIGYFGILTMPIALLTLMITFILQPNIVGLSKVYVQREVAKFEATVMKIARYVLIGALILFGAIIVGGIPLLNMVFNIDIKDYQAALYVVVAGAFANTIVGVMMNILTIMRHFRVQFYLLLLANALLVIACGVLVPSHGLLAAVTLYAATNALQAAGLYVAYVLYIRRYRLAS